jgi:hypothetical protein
MSIQHAIWKVGDTPTPLPVCRLPSEQKLEEMIVEDPSILSSEWMLIGRQEPTAHGGRIDLLAIAPDGSLVLIELKRNRTPREIVSQALDYASWVSGLKADKIVQIYQRFSNGGDLDAAFLQRFKSPLDEDTLNASHQVIIVAAELDDATERIIGYLNEREIAINVIFFNVFEHGADQFLSRAWLIDPGKTQANVAITTTRGEKEPWNGEYYVSFGPMESRSWVDARTYGYICAGGGAWYSQTLKMLSPGDRVWVNIPTVGYVGVGRVTESAVPAKEFKVKTPQGERSSLEVLKHSDSYKSNADDPEKTEWFVRVEWFNTVSEDKPVKELGFFGNQNTVCQPVTPSWRHTVERLKAHFPKWDDRTV